MFPSNPYMDPYFSQNKDQIPYPPYQFYPCLVPNRPDPSAQSASYAPWPYHFNPTHSNGCTYPPGYFGPRPPFPYDLPPPNFPNYYNPYFTSMPNYLVKYPQIDHTTSQTHCCGCPNHVCHRTDSPNIKTDEENPDMDPRKIPNESYPFFWFPPRNKLQQDEIDISKKERKETQFPWPLIWMPQDEIKKENKDKPFRWPIIWTPEDGAKDTKDQHAKDTEDQHANKRAFEEAAKPSFRIIPLKFLEHGEKDQSEMQKFPVVEKKQGNDELGKEQRDHGHKDQAKVKIIPVLEKKEGSEKIEKEQSVKVSTGDKVTEKKQSKLPPVCLRVDPLPHKRQTNGSPQNKKEVKVVDVRSVKDDRKERETETKRALKEKKLEGRKVEDFSTFHMPEKEKIKKEIKVSDAKGAEGRELEEKDIQAEVQRDKLEERMTETVKKSEISDQDAAVLIQSVYRGYNVRRWDPLEKLKKVRSVHEKAQELLGKLQRVEESAISLEKEQQLVLSESIMNLLLQLDTIQGLHPTVREARKSVARELVSLQEKLDSLEKQKVVESPTNEAEQLQLECRTTASTDQPTSTISSEGCKSVSEQVDLQPSEAPTMECMKTTKEDEKACDISKEEDIAVKLDVPQSATDFNPDHATPGSTLEESQVTPVLEGTCSTSEESLVTQVLEETCSTSKEAQMTLPLEETELSGLLQETVARNDNIEAQLSPQTENSQSVESMGKVELHAAGVVPTVATETNTADMASAVTLSESGTNTSHIFSESEMNDTAVTSSVTEDIHDTVVAPDVAVSDGLDRAATQPETQNLDGVGCEEEIHVHATESDAKDAQETAPENTLKETPTKEVDLQEALVTKLHSEAATHSESQNLGGLDYEEEIHVHATKSDSKNAQETVPDAALIETATKEVELKEAQVTREESQSHGSDAGASMDKTELQAIEDGKPISEENKTDSPLTASQEVKVNATEVLPEESHVDDGGACAEDVELLATEVDKSVENKTMEYQVTSLPEDGKSEEHSEPEAEVHLNLTQTNAVEAVPEVEVTDNATEVDKLSLEEKKLVEENEKLRVMLEKLMEAGRNQLDVISGLNERMKGLEKKLERKTKKSKVRVKKHKPVMVSSIEV